MSMTKDLVSRTIAEQLREAFDPPKDFKFNGQTFEERCDAWARHVFDQIETEIESVEDGETGNGGVTP